MERYNGYMNAGRRNLAEAIRANAMTKTRIGMLLVALVALVATPLMADDVADEAPKYWPQWRGPTWNGVASQADPPVSWSETKNLRWKTPIEGNGWATPIIWGDRIFLLTAIALDKEMPVPDVIPAGTPNINKHP